MKWNLLDEHMTSEEALKQSTFKQRFIPFFLFIWVGTLVIRITFKGTLFFSSTALDALGIGLVETLMTFLGLIFYNRILFDVRPIGEVFKRTLIGVAVIANSLIVLKAFQVVIVIGIIYFNFGEEVADDSAINLFLYEAYWLDFLWISMDFIFIFFIIHMMNILKHK